MVFLKEFFGKKNLQMTKKHEKLPSRKRVNDPITIAADNTFCEILDKWTFLYHAPVHQITFFAFLHYTWILIFFCVFLLFFLRFHEICINFSLDETDTVVKYVILLQIFI